MEGNNLTSFQNLCKIFEMRIKLDKENYSKTSIEVLNNYEKYSRKIDSIYNDQFQKELKHLISPATTLEKEKDRLRRLIKLLEDRIDKRVDLEDRFYKATGENISGLQMIVSDEELEDKKERLSLVTKYLDTVEEINSIDEGIVKLNKLLKEEEEKRKEYESKNQIMEDELYSSFTSIIKDDDYYRNISEEDITIELDKIMNSVSETKETLDITKDSIGSLMNNGLEGDYVSYIEEAEKNYYNFKNKEIILTIYKLVSNFEDDFKLICAKREKISDLLNEKRELSENLVIDVNNELLSFEKVLLLQNVTLDNEKEILDNINNYISRINFKEERLEELKESNSSVEILALLREYGLIETYDTDDSFIKEENISLELPVIMDNEEIVVEHIYNPYRIVDVVDYPKTLNVGLAKLKGESVREKVNKKLNPKNIEETSAVISSDTIENEIQSNEEEHHDDLVSLEENKVDIVENNNEKTIQIPVWEIPSEVEPKPVVIENNDSEILPVWETIKPEFEIKETEVIKDNAKEEFNDNLFWVPVSEAKMESNKFPNLNLPINNIDSNDSEFIFPNINN